MISAAWFAQHDLPAGPFAGPLTLLALHQGRRLHLDARCPQFARMSQTRGTFPVTVSLAQLDPQEHLCHVCAKRLPAYLLDPTVAESAPRREYLRAAKAVLAVRDRADRLAAAVTDLPPGRLPAPRSVAGLERLAREITAQCTPDPPGLAAAVRELTARLDGLVQQARSAWAGADGQRALARFAVSMTLVEAGLGKARGVRALPCYAEREGELAAAPWVGDAALAGWSQWLSALAGGLDWPQARAEAVAAAVAAVPEHPGVGEVPWTVGARPGGSLAQLVRANCQAYAGTVTDELVNCWQRAVLDRMGPGALEPVLVCRQRGQDIDPANVTVLGRRRAQAGTLELVVVAAAVAQAARRARALPELSGAAVQAPDEVLELTVRLRAQEQMTLPAAYEAARAVLADPVAAAS